MDFKFLHNKNVLDLFNLFYDDKERLYVVGGAVRNELWNVENNDIDFATSTKPKKVLDILSYNKIEVDLKGMHYGTISAIIDNQKFDITTFRKDHYFRGSRFPQIICSKKILDDYKRRDFTINALYVDKFSRIIDLGSGMNDIENKIVKFIINPKRSVFFDPLRILRYFRFCSLYCYENFDDASLNICCQKFDKVLKVLSHKRIQSEIDLILKGNGAKIILDIWDRHGIIQQMKPFIEGENDK